MFTLASPALLLAQPSSAADLPNHERNPDDGYRLLDGHYVGRVGCDHRGDLNTTQPIGNFSLRQCKERCNT